MSDIKPIFKCGNKKCKYYDPNEYKNCADVLGLPPSCPDFYPENDENMD